MANLSNITLFPSYGINVKKGRRVETAENWHRDAEKVKKLISAKA